jgi:hypothetical protein
MKFENVYWDAGLMADDAHSASILAIGDSWFWYPFPGGSLLNPLGRVVAGKQHTLLAIGNNGAEAFDYVHGKYRTQVRTTLQHHGSGLSAVFISGGGNDFAGYNDLRPLLKDDCSKFKTAAACYRPGDDERTLGWLMKKTAENHSLLIGQIFMMARPGTQVFLHNYDYAYPSGKGVFGGQSDWLKPALVAAKVPARLRHLCIKHLINQLTKTLEELVKQDPQRIFLVDSRDTLKQGDWANELHPKPAGFKKIAEQKWQPVLSAHGLA